MRKIIKRTLCVLSATMCVLGTAATASADTVSFNVTIPGDPYSYAVRKADTEQRFYVTGTSFNKSGTLRCRSGKADREQAPIRRIFLLVQELPLPATHLMQRLIIHTRCMLPVEQVD